MAACLLLFLLTELFLVTLDEFAAHLNCKRLGTVVVISRNKVFLV